MKFHGGRNTRSENKYLLNRKMLYITIVIIKLKNNYYFYNNN